MLVSFSTIFVLFVMTVVIFFGAAMAEHKNHHTVLMIASLFVTLLGISLLLVCIPLGNQSVTYGGHAVRGLRKKFLEPDFLITCELRAQSRWCPIHLWFHKF